MGSNSGDHYSKAMAVPEPTACLPSGSSRGDTAWQAHVLRPPFIASLHRGYHPASASASAGGGACPRNLSQQTVQPRNTKAQSMQMTPRWRSSQVAQRRAVGRPHHSHGWCPDRQRRRRSNANAALRLPLRSRASLVAVVTCACGMSLARWRSRASPQTFAPIHARRLAVTALLTATIASAAGVLRETMASVEGEPCAQPVVPPVPPAC